MRLLILGFLLATLLLAANWQTAAELPGVDLSGLSPTGKSAALKMLREQDCNCGCALKIAQCRITDSQCSYSRALAAAVVREFKAGRGVDRVLATLRKMQQEGAVKPRLLEDPVPIPTAGAPFRGPESAPITVVEFSDFQCPYCSLAAPKALAVVAAYPETVRLVFKQFPLDMHSQANLAAQAALAAHAQGRFWPLHDLMFANYRQLSRQNILRWASECGIDMVRFTHDLDSGKYRAEVEREVQEGENAGVMGTPTFFVNGKRYNGPFNVEALKPIFEAELGSQHRLVHNTVYDRGSGRSAAAPGPRR